MSLIKVIINRIECFIIRNSYYLYILIFYYINGIKQMRKLGKLEVLT